MGTCNSSKEKEYKLKKTDFKTEKITTNNDINNILFTEEDEINKRIGNQKKLIIKNWNKNLNKLHKYNTISYCKQSIINVNKYTNKSFSKKSVTNVSDDNKYIIGEIQPCFILSKKNIFTLKMINKTISEYSNKMEENYESKDRYLNKSKQINKIEINKNKILQNIMTTPNKKSKTKISENKVVCSEISKYSNVLKPNNYSNSKYNLHNSNILINRTINKSKNSSWNIISK